MLKAGMAADFAVFSTDLTQVPKEELGKVYVYETFVDGVQVYKRGERL